MVVIGEFRTNFERDDEIIDPKKRLYLDDGGWTTGELPRGYELRFQGKVITYYMEDHRIDEFPLPIGEIFDKIYHNLSEEIRIIQAKGLRIEHLNPMGIGLKQELIDLIKAVKAEFGNDFYIQIVINDADLNAFFTDQLAEANLDELIFHPAFSTIEKVRSFESAIEYIFKVGLEVSLPEKMQNSTPLINLADYLGSIDMNFLTLLASNDDSNNRGIGESLIQGSGSIENLPIIYLPPKLWNERSRRNRFFLRATAIRRPFEEITSEGFLRFLQIEGNSVDIKKIQSILTEQLKIPKKMQDLSFNEHKLDISPIWADNPQFKNIIGNLSVRAGIFECVPFRESNFSEDQKYYPIQDQISDFYYRHSRKKKLT